MTYTSRVRVLDGDGKTLLGYGFYEGMTNVQIAVSELTTISHTDGSEFSPEEKDTLIAQGFTDFIDIETPKLRMEDGRVFFGCQVWWDFVA